MSPAKALEAALTTAFSAKKPIHLGVAVSGGGDSMALLHLAADWARAGNVTLSAATVDHGLRPEAADEARMVAKNCARLGVAHQVLHWGKWDSSGNLQDAARRARYGLLSSWALENKVDALALGHTKDDQAETFLMRLARGSGVDGLSAMRGEWQSENIHWLRPLLGVQRQVLRDYLTAKGIDWAEDPSNDDLRYDRVKARQALVLLAPLGIDADRLATTAQNLTRARRALVQATFHAARDLCETQNGDVLISKDANNLPEEVFHRLFAHALGWVSSAPYRPRYEALLATLAQVWGGERRSLHGCLISPEGGKVRISREYQSVKGVSCAPTALWDQRWQLTGRGDGLEVRALGRAVKDCPDWRQTGMVRASLMASPALWRGPDLVAAPVAGLMNGWDAKIVAPDGDFALSILSH